MGNIQDGEIDWSDLKYTSDDAEIKQYSLSAGTVLFNRTNSPALVGKSAVYRGDREAIFAGYLIAVRCSEELVPDYLSLLLNSEYGRQWRTVVKTDGVSQSNISGSKLVNFPVLWWPRDTQLAIVDRVTALKSQVIRVRSSLEAATRAAAAVSDAAVASLHSPQG
jgi:type I restriction enzyme S subunit